MNINTPMLKDLKKLGIKEGGYLLVHSSYKSLGSGAKDIAQIIATLQAALGPDGTLMFPSLSYEAVGADPNFDIKTTPSCIGAIPEWFRQQPEVFRSMSPTHSITAIGPGAKVITAGHDLDDTPVGPNSPLRKLRDLGGQILMLGCGLLPNTSMHGVEELAPPPYLFNGTTTYTCT
ncbi:MAG: AAC(3) family N-acetyltransferase, partial [Defluviitaleaceae bacterium]|nr:AAC(3) family N-acetyltransferase [Defluviitaleaceae bacterium]